MATSISRVTAFVLALGLYTTCAHSMVLRPRDCAPGGEHDLTTWELQLPTGSSGDPTTISSNSLQGCNGFQDQYFYSSNNAIVMTVPGSPDSSGCVTTPNSEHCRTEFREMNSDGSPASWDPNSSTNRLKATLVVSQADNSEYGTVIGQVHIDDSVSSKPVCELYYNQNGDIHMGVEQTRSGGDEVLTYIANVPVNRAFTYQIDYSSGNLQVAINNQTKGLSTYSLDSPPSYFKAGNYNQGSSPSNVQFLALSILH